MSAYFCLTRWLLSKHDTRAASFLKCFCFGSELRAFGAYNLLVVTYHRLRQCQGLGYVPLLIMKIMI